MATNIPTRTISSLAEIGTGNSIMISQTAEQLERTYTAKHGHPPDEILIFERPVGGAMYMAIAKGVKASTVQWAYCHNCRMGHYHELQPSGKWRCPNCLAQIVSDLVGKNFG